MATLRVTLDQIVTILNDPTYKTGQKKIEQRNKIWKIARPAFNFNEISRRAIGKPWKKFSPEEKQRFSAVFSEFLGSTYIDKLQGGYNNEQIDFSKERIKGSKAVVWTWVKTENLQIPIIYRMHMVNGQWKVYDILIENNVSLIKNYRVQFASMLKDGTPADLIARLEKKLAKQNLHTP